jgi:hypothetical protein
VKGPEEWRQGVHEREVDVEEKKAPEFRANREAEDMNTTKERGGGCHFDFESHRSMQISSGTLAENCRKLSWKGAAGRKWESVGMVIAASGYLHALGEANAKNSPPAQTLANRGGYLRKMPSPAGTILRESPQICA